MCVNPCKVAVRNDRLNSFGDAAHDVPAENTLGGIAAEIGFHQRSGHTCERNRFNGKRKHMGRTRRSVAIW